MKRCLKFMSEQLVLPGFNKIDQGSPDRCAFADLSPCHGNKIDWHHPCQRAPNVGGYLCEGHHSLLKDRGKQYAEERNYNLWRIRELGQKRVEQWVLEAGLSVDDIDKY